ncbi:MAG: hypothetical protein AAGF92_17885 [Myxococcota bacterium]
MITPRAMRIASMSAFVLAAAACGDGGSAQNAGASGVGGMGGEGGGPPAGVSCVVLPNGCNDGNPCTVDGNCESVTGRCIGRANEPLDTPCGPDDIFVCDGEGTCVGCTTDDQCEGFFTDEECRVAPACVDRSCPLPDPLPNGTPCSTGECRDGFCTSPWAPKQQLVPMICGVSFWEDPIESPMNITVAPTPIASGETFSARIDASLHVPRLLLQQLVIAAYPDRLDTLLVAGGRAEVSSLGVASGTPVETTLQPLPQVVQIRQVPNAGDPGGQACTVSSDCPLSGFGQRCSPFSGTCVCACREGCSPSFCPNLVVADAVLSMEPIQGAIYSPLLDGEVCFDVSGDYVSPEFSDRVRTGIRVTTFPGPFAIECAGGSIDDNGTLDVSDDVVVPNPPNDQICFPIGQP